jgi:hypothetical protein
MRFLCRTAITGLLLAFAACSPPVKNGGIYFDEQYYENDGIYENRDVKFNLRLSGKWDVCANPKAMLPAARDFAKDLEKQGADLLFSGTTADGRQAVRCIVTNSNMSAPEYAQAIRDANADSVTADSGLSFLYPEDSSVVKWEYSVAQFRFCEYFYQLGTYDMRLAFWSDPSTFDRFKVIFENTAKSVHWFGY